ncbi:MAG: murein hydrolase activator EnvC family protein [Actinomycetota bacterium]
MSLPQGSPRPRLLRAAAAVLLVLSVTSAAAAGTDDELQSARERLHELKRELRAEQASLVVLDAEIESLTRMITQAYAQKIAIDDRIEFIRKEIEKKDRQGDRLQERLNERAREAYIAGPGGVFEVILESDSLAELSDRALFLDLLSGADADLAAGVAYQRTELDEFRLSLTDLLSQQAELLDDLRVRGRELEAKFGKQAAITNRIEERFQELEGLIEDLKTQRQQEAILAAVTTPPPAPPAPPPIVSGKAPVLQVCPVAEPRSYIDDWHFPRPGGRVHEGNDIFSEDGARIFAPFDGLAREHWGRLGGLAVLVYAPDGTFVYNAHMSRYAGVHGKTVQAGDVIGFVGHTGNAVGTPSHNHFQYHPGGGEPVNPFPFLNAVCR